jgi:cell division septation protein DedD
VIRRRSSRSDEEAFVRQNSVLIGITLLSLFALSLVAGYAVGERYFKPQRAAAPAESPGAALPPPPTAPAAPGMATPRLPGPGRTPGPVVVVPQPTPAPATAPPAPSPPAAEPPPSPPPAAAPGERLYTVQVGAFAQRDNASEMVARLMADGFSPYIVREGNLFKVRVGAFRERERANQLVQRLRARGYSAAVLF